MLYKAFATITLIAAPIIVLVAQNVTPQHAAQPSPAAIQPVAQPAAPVTQPPPLVAPAVPAPDPSAFGQPMPEAGQPFLTPGNGLPGAPAPAPVEGESGEGAVQAISGRVPS